MVVVLHETDTDLDLKTPKASGIADVGAVGSSSGSAKEVKSLL